MPVYLHGCVCVYVWLLVYLVYKPLHMCISAYIDAWGCTQVSIHRKSFTIR